MFGKNIFIGYGNWCRITQIKHLLCNKIGVYYKVAL
jgi:hypothetical protein